MSCPPRRADRRSPIEVLEHFLRGVLEETPRGDVERYLEAILDCDLSAAEVVQRVAPDRTVATFEELKQRLFFDGQTCRREPTKPHKCM